MPAWRKNREFLAVELAGMSSTGKGEIDERPEL
jgi:hypothetical protein